MPEPITVRTTGAVGVFGAAVRLVYDPADPYAVYVYVYDWTIGSEVVWVFGRDLLDAGLKLDDDGAVTGEGEVIITRVSKDTAKITRIVRGGWVESEVILVAARVRSFLEASYALVPPGQESQTGHPCPATPPTAPCPAPTNPDPSGRLGR
ncbi:MAG: SsgA family sporulation/cell division regulator [Saccharothrix sp.]|nr:SsgA family sporulation/cell division regulator [Saccharothrix sp.]